MSGFSTILGGGGSGIATVNFSIQTSATGTIPDLYIDNSITDTAGYIVAIQNTNISAITLSVAGGSIVNNASYAAITTSNSITVEANQTVVLETDVANLNYYIVAYSQAVEFTGGGANQLLYQTAANATGYIAAGTNNQVLSNVSGVPTWATSAPLALDLTGGGSGQLVYQAGANNTAFLPAGVIDQVLVFDGTSPDWANAAPQAANLSGGVAGSVVYQTGSGLTGYTPAGTAGYVLQANGSSAPSWTTTPTFGGVTVTQAGSTGSPVTVNSSNTRGGAGFAEVMAMTNTTSGATNASKFLRLNTTGTLELINSAYTATILSVADSGIVTTGGAIWQGASQTNTNPNTGNNNGIRGSNGYITYQDNLQNIVLGDYTQTGHDTWIETGRSVFITSGGVNATATNAVNTISLLSSGQALFGTSSTTPLVGYGAPKLGVYSNSSSTDGATIIAYNSNNTLNLGKVAPNANGSGAAGGFIAFVGNGSTGTATYGNITVNGAGVSYNQTSDARMKEDVVTITDGLSKVKALNPVSFKWIGSGESSIGFIAQEAEKVVPEAVTAPIEGQPSHEYYSMDYAKVVPLLAAAIKELSDRLDKAGL